MLCYAMLCYPMLCYPMLCYVILCYARHGVAWHGIYCIVYRVNLLTSDPAVILHLLPPTVMINFSRSLLLPTSRYLPYRNNENFVSLATIMTNSTLLFK